MKRKLFRFFGFFFFHLGAVKLLNRVATRWEYRLHTSGKIGFRSFKRRRSGIVQILSYHRVNNDNDPFFFGTPVHAFRKQMEYLAANFNTCSLDQAVEMLARKDVPDNTLVVTFDDGYRDNYANAFPVLQELSIPATIFLATDAVGSQTVIWHDRVFSAFRQTRVNLLKGCELLPRCYSLNTLEDKLIAQREVLSVLRSCHENERLFLIDLLVKKLEVKDLQEAPNLMLSWHEVRAMHKLGISFGSHTASHPILSKVPDNQARHEIESSKTVIEKNLRSPVTTFAYPNGKKADFNECTKRLVREAGYVCALTTEFGGNGTDQDLFELRRATPWDQDIWSFALRLNQFKLCS